MNKRISFRVEICVGKLASRKKVSELTPSEYNPRIIDEAAIAALGYSLEEFGDLGGIVFNVGTGSLVGGHQRQTVLPASATIEIVNRYKKPTRTGTVAEGYVLYKGERFGYREVSWPEAKHKAALVAANSPSLQGEYSTKLTALLDEIKLELPASFEHMNLDELYAVPITFEIPDAFGPDDMRGSFSGNLRTHSEYSSVTILLPKDSVEVVRDAIKKLGRDPFAEAITTLSRKINAKKR